MLTSPSESIFKKKNFYIFRPIQEDTKGLEVTSKEIS